MAKTRKIERPRSDDHHSDLHCRARYARIDNLRTLARKCLFGAPSILRAGIAVDGAVCFGSGSGVALIAKADGVPIGTCLLAESEIEPNHDVSPWLAGLFVVPEHRRKGAGAVLVRAIEDQARQRGFSRLYLYTTEAVEFYARLGWTVVDHTNWKGFDTALMVRDLS